jgi:hypothetical protein
MESDFIPYDYTNENPVKKSKIDLCGIFVSRISLKEDLNQVLNYCSECTNFIPSFRGKHIGIAYFLFKSQEQRNLQASALASK